jgi:Alpha galactosidase A
MKSILQPSRLLVFVSTLLVLETGNMVAAPLGTAFNYQGRLQQSGNPANGLYDFQFSLWDDVGSGTLVGATQAVMGITVNNGLFGAPLDFGPGPFNGSARWLEVGMRTNGGGLFSALSPRQPLLPMPYALMAGTASNLLGTLPATQLSGTLPSSALAGYSGLVTFTNAGNSFVGTFIGNGGGLINLAGAAIQPGTVNSNALDAPTKAQLAMAGSGGGGLINGGTGTNLTLVSGTNVFAPLLVPFNDHTNFYITPVSWDTNLGGAYHWMSNLNYYGDLLPLATNGLYTLIFDFFPDFMAHMITVFNVTNQSGITYAAITNNSVGPIVAYADSSDAFLLGQLYTNGHASDAYVSALTNYAAMGWQVVGPAIFSNSVIAQSFVGDGSAVTNVHPEYADIANFPFTLRDRPDATLRAFPTPPMGWNTWMDMSFVPYAFRITNIARMFITNGLHDAGYRWIEVDDGWYGGRDATHHVTNNGYIPDMRGLADTLHSWGFKLGLYYRDVQFNANYPKEDAESLANWDIDYVKLDEVLESNVTNGWLETFATTADILYRSNNRAPLFINGHMPEDDPSDPSWRPIAQQILNSRFATQDVSPGPWLSSGLWYMTNADWYIKAVPCHWLQYDWGTIEYAETNWHQRFQAIASLNIMIGGEMVLSRMWDQPVVAVGQLTNVTRTLDILTNREALRILNDPAQMVSRLAYQSAASQAWIKPLGSASKPMEWAVALMNLDQTPGLTTNLSFDLSSFPQLIRPVTVKEVWSGQTWTASGLLTASNLVNGECRIYRITPYAMPSVGITTNYTIPGGLTLYITNGVIMKIQ